MKRFDVEYPLCCSTSSLFRAVSTCSGLKEWFAEDVQSSDNVNFAFYWQKIPQHATVVTIKENKFIRFQWNDDVHRNYFEFKINHQELTGDISLIITDFALENEHDEAINLWNIQVGKLKRSIGCAKK